MDQAPSPRERLVPLLGLLGVFPLLVVGIWLVTFRAIGLDFSLIPGDLGDARFNNYILEHAFRRLTGLDTSFWRAPFFYPFPQTIAFGDTFLGSAPFYIFFRLLGLDRETAFQGWYIFGFILNYTAATYILRKYKFNPLAAAAGGFFFTFGLPLLGQVNHVQLIYRFAIPIACYTLWCFLGKPRLFTLVSLLYWFVWQFYLGIYLGVFLALILVAMVLLLPFFYAVPPRQRLNFWPQKLKAAWAQSGWPDRTLSMLALLFLSFTLLFLLLPYYRVTRIYNFPRPWEHVVTMLPRWQSYLLADKSPLWNFSAHIAPGLLMRHEHQLFPGMATSLLILIGIKFHPVTSNQRMAWLHLTIAAVLIVFTLYFRGFTLYKLFWWIPGINSIRAVTRIILALMWPIAFFISYTMDWLLQSHSRNAVLSRSIAVLLTCLLVIDSATFEQVSYSKRASQDRLKALRAQIPEMVPQDPILFIATKSDEPWWMTEIDAMMLSQDLGWPTLNGYSGNLPPGFELGDHCALIPKRIQNYMEFAEINNEKFYGEMIKRIVPVGFKDCDFNLDSKKLE